MRLSPRTSTEPGYGPRIESYLSRCASVALSVMSLTATHSMSVSLARPARSTFRPMRPNPLIPTRTGMRFSPFCDDDPRAPGGYRAGGGACAPVGLPRAADELEPRAVRVDQITGIVARRTGGAGAARRGRAGVAAAGGEPRLVGSVHRAPAQGEDRDVAPRRARIRPARPRHQPELRAVAAVADAVGR